jgi:hypothetical protein
MKKALRKTLVAPWEVGMERPRSHIEPGIPASEKQPKSARWHVPETTLEIKLPPILQKNRPTDRLELLVQMRERGGWRRADPDIPILKQAKAEYAKLQ